MKAAPYCLRFLLLAGFILIVVSSAVAETTSREEARTAREAPVQPDDAFLARLCDRPPRVLPWCEQLHATRRQGAQHHRLLPMPMPMPPPSRDDEEVDPRYGVSKRLVPSGPNMLHH